MAADDSHSSLPWRNRLGVRFGAALVLAVALVLLALGLWNISTQRRHMIRLTEQAAHRCSTLIRSATRDGMLANEPARVQAIIQTIASSEGVARVRILDRDGVVRRSSQPLGEAHALPVSAFQCQICHALDPVPAHLAHESRMRVVEGEDGERYLNVVEPIPNEKACATADCHAHKDDRRVLGIIDIDLPLQVMDDQIAESEQQMGLGLLLTLAGVTAVAGFLTWRQVVQPVRQLSAAAERVGRGDLTARVPVGWHDEIGRLGSSWNHMVGDLESAREELQTWSDSLERRVEEKTAELEAAHQRMLVVEKMASLGKLAAVMAHEINNPLAGIATYAKLSRRRVEKAMAEGREPVDPDALRNLELVETEAQRCGNIVKNLLLFSRTPGARFTKTDLTALFERCILLVNHQAQLQEIEIRLEVADDLPPIDCDASQIQQVVLALVMNAMEAMPGGGVLTLSARRAPEAGRIVVQVEDTGCGIKREDLPHVFEPFHTTKDQGEGVGLGLSVVYGIVERHHGRVDVDSTLNQGTTFTVRLPIRQPRDEETSQS